MLKQLGLITLLLSIIACSGESEEHKILHKASDIHVEALKIKKELEPDLEKLRQISNRIQIQGRALSAEELRFTKSVAALESRLAYWEENHVEVPGFEHEGHDHSGHDHSGHDHSHAPKFQLPASDILIIQKEFRDSIIAIKGKIGAILSKAPQ